MSRQPKHKRSAAQAAASRTAAAAGRASQARRRAAQKARGLPTRTKAQTQASQRWAAAGREAQARKRAGLRPLPVKKRALAGGQGTSRILAACRPVDAFMILAEANRVYPCCAATAVASHLYVMTGILASGPDILRLHFAAGGEDGALIPELLEVASGGFAGARVTRFWPVGDLSLPGTIAGSQLPGGSHAVLILPGAACVTWGRIAPLAGAEEAWWAEWADERQEGVLQPRRQGDPRLGRDGDPALVDRDHRQRTPVS